MAQPLETLTPLAVNRFDYGSTGELWQKTRREAAQSFNKM
jgi:hypothetical protein